MYPSYDIAKKRKTKRTLTAIMVDLHQPYNIITDFGNHTNRAPSSSTKFCGWGTSRPVEVDARCIKYKK